MRSKSFAWATVAICIAVLGYWGVSSGAKECAPQTGIAAEKVADYLHAVLQSDRTFYTVNVVERLQAKGVVTASENWQTENLLPLPAQFLHESNRLANATATGIGYRLISLWPINKRNGGKTEFENRGLQETLKDPNRAYTEVVMNGPDAYLQAVYADKAITQACIGCHNAHPDSPKRDFKQNDVMGGMLISIPLKEVTPKAGTKSGTK
jgi:uncharacterized protein DUF3365